MDYSNYYFNVNAPEATIGAPPDWEGGLNGDYGYIAGAAGEQQSFQNGTNMMTVTPLGGVENIITIVDGLGAIWWGPTFVTNADLAAGDLKQYNSGPATTGVSVKANALPQPVVGTIEADANIDSLYAAAEDLPAWAAENTAHLVDISTDPLLVVLTFSEGNRVIDLQGNKTMPSILEGTLQDTSTTMIGIKVIVTGDWNGAFNITNATGLEDVGTLNTTLTPPPSPSGKVAVPRVLSLGKMPASKQELVVYGRAVAVATGNSEVATAAATYQQTIQQLYEPSGRSSVIIQKAKDDEAALKEALRKAVKPIPAAEKKNRPIILSPNAPDFKAKQKPGRVIVSSLKGKPKNCVCWFQYEIRDMSEDDDGQGLDGEVTKTGASIDVSSLGDITVQMRGRWVWMSNGQYVYGPYTPWVKFRLLGNGGEE